MIHYICGLCRPPHKPHLTPSQWQARNGGYKHKHGQNSDNSTRPNHLHKRVMGAQLVCSLAFSRNQITQHLSVHSPFRTATVTDRRTRARILHGFTFGIAHTMVHHAAGAHNRTDTLDAGSAFVGRIATAALFVPVLHVELLTVAVCCIFVSME